MLNPASGYFKAILGGAALALLTLAPYAQVGDFGFLDYDDPLHVTGNPWVSGGLGWEMVKAAFGFQMAPTWVPLTFITHAIDQSLFGGWAGGHHLVNVAFHLANALLVFGLFHRLGGCWGRSWLVAALFAVHPVNVESVAWVAERKDVLSTFFLLLCLHAYVGYGRRGGGLRYGASLLAYALAAASKSMVMTLPVLLLLLDLWGLGRWGGRSWWRDGLRLLGEKTPFILVAAAVVAANAWGHHIFASFLSWSAVPLDHRVLIALSNYATYLGHLAWPGGLTILYPQADVVSAAKVAAGALALAAGSVLALRRARSQPLVALGWFWFLVALLPVIGLMRAGNLVFNDRFTYLPGIGLFAALAWGLPWSRLGRLRVPLVAAPLAALAVACFQQVGYWRDDYALFGHALAVTEGNLLAHVNLAARLERDGRLDEAERHAQAALAIQPDDGKAMLTLGNLARRAGEFDRAEQWFRAATERHPDDPVSWYNLGSLQFQRGQRAKAIVSLEKAVAARVAPNSEALNNLGAALLREGRLDEARLRFQQALDANPNNAAARQNLARLPPAR